MSKVSKWRGAGSGPEPRQYGSGVHDFKSNIVKVKVLLKKKTRIWSTVGIMAYKVISDRFPGTLMEAKLPEKTLGVLRENLS